MVGFSSAITLSIPTCARRLKLIEPAADSEVNTGAGVGAEGNAEAEAEGTVGKDVVGRAEEEEEEEEEVGERGAAAPGAGCESRACWAVSCAEPKRAAMKEQA
eukprot:1158139-Pelagomonas_calceolata.AAC.9